MLPERPERLLLLVERPGLRVDGRLRAANRRAVVPEDGTFAEPGKRVFLKPSLGLNFIVHCKPDSACPRIFREWRFLIVASYENIWPERKIMIKIFSPIRTKFIS